MPSSWVLYSPNRLMCSVRYGVRCRIDFKYALGLELEDPGFHHSVLSDFRDRLAEGDRADRLLGLALTRIRRAGLLKGRAARASRPFP